VTRVSIRLASALDLPRVVEVVSRAYEIYVSRISRRPAPMDADYGSLVSGHLVHVAIKEGEIVGVIVFEPCRDHLFIENVAVDPGHQREGIGRLLLLHAEQTARALGLPEIRLYTNAAMFENLALYPRLGYRKTHRTKEAGFDRVFFVKPLASQGQAP
jgi:ribosomal protein S18 acetylase RimI-like enzyme